MEPAPLIEIPFFWKSSIRLPLIVALPVVPSAERPTWIAVPFWQPLNGSSRMCVMRLPLIVAEPPASTRPP